MAIPVYIICSESGSVDQITNNVSLFSVIEKLFYVKIEHPDDYKKLPKQPPLANVRSTAVWKREESEAGTTFEHQTLMLLPGEEKPSIVAEGSFVFKGTTHRMIYDFGPVSFNEGTVRIESRIRELGQEKWQSQTYEFPVERIILSDKPTSD